MRDGFTACGTLGMRRPALGWFAMLAVLAIRVVLGSCVATFRGRGPEARPGSLYCSAAELEA